jgi:hypothetical protein
MKTRTISILAVLLLLAGLSLVLPAGQGQQDKYLSLADVQKVSGLSGIKQVPRNAEADGDLNFARQDGKIILSVSIYPASAYASAKSSRTGFKSTVQGIGEEAFIGPAEGPPLYILAFRKGAHTVIINTELESRTSTRITMEQLTAIAKLMASRM